MDTVLASDTTAYADYLTLLAKAGMLYWDIDALDEAPPFFVGKDDSQISC